MNWSSIAVTPHITATNVGNGQKQHTSFVETKSRASTNNGYQTGTDEDEEYSDEEDSDYEPINIAAWGDHAKKEPEQPATWGSLADPGFKVKPGELGSGSLHRRGGNFKPISEEYIIAQRKGKGIPGAPGSGKKKSRGGKKKKTAVTVASRPPVKSLIRPSVRPPVRPSLVAAARRVVPVPSYLPPVRKLPTNVPPSSWTSQTLVETPFWEQKKTPVVPAPVPMNSPSFFKLGMQNEKEAPPTIPSTSTFTTSSITSRIITSSTKRQPSTATTNTTSETSTTTKNIPKLNPQVVEFTPTSTTRKSWNISAASFEPPTVVTTPPPPPPLTASTSPIPKFNPNAPAFNSFDPSTSPSCSQNITPTNLGVAIVPSPSLTTTTTTATLSSPNSTSSSTTTVASRHTFNTNVPEFLPFVQIPEKKPVKISAPPHKPAAKEKPGFNPTSTSTKIDDANATAVPTTKMPSMFTNNPLVRRQLQQINQDISGSTNERAAVNVTPIAPTTITPATNIIDQFQQLSVDTQTGPESTRGLEEPKPLIQLNMELAPGISTEILVYENSDPAQLAEDFATYHRLNVTNTAKAKIALTISHLLQEKKASISSIL